MEENAWWEKLPPEEQDAERKAQASRSYQSLLVSASKTLSQKEKEYGRTTTGVVIIAALLFAVWLWHEGAWQEKLDRALADCTVPMSDGSCAHWDREALRERD